MHYFLDTNVLLDLFDEQRSTSDITRCFFEINGNASFSCSEDMISTFFYLVSKTHSNIKIITFWEQLKKIVTILPFGERAIIKSFTYCKQNPNADLEDVLQAFCAKENNCEALVTNDKKFVSDIIGVIYPPNT